jgi:hypothetical protein
VYGLYEYRVRLVTRLKRRKSLDDQKDHKRNKQASHQDEQVYKVKLFPHLAISQCEWPLVEWKPGHQTINKSIYHYQEHDKAEPCKKPEKSPYNKILHRPESFQVNLLHE